VTDRVPRIIWTAAGIGREIGRSAAFVRDNLAKQPASPVHKMGTQYWAYADELIAFFDRAAKTKVG
jgi:hypothetical protein